MTARRDYSLNGPEPKRAWERGLVSADWHKYPVPRARMKELMRRSHFPGLWHLLLWFALIALFGVLAFLSWGTWWAVPAFIAYSTVLPGSSDPRWHECGHGTAFKTQWINNVVYNFASFFLLREPTVWRWSHTRHHTDTIIVGRDPEIAAKRPPPVARILGNFLGLVDAPLAFKLMLRHAAGSLAAEEKDYVPESEWPKVYRAARIWLVIYAATAVACVATGSILPAMYIGLPRLYGAWHHLMTGLTQHGGLAEDVLDHRMNSRTVYINPVSRFIYWNMNYHIEHHMFPLVPYHALPQLHEELKADLPPACHGFRQAYREIIPALRRQLREPAYFVHRELPPSVDTAAPQAAAG